MSDAAEDDGPPARPAFAAGKALVVGGLAIAALLVLILGRTLWPAGQPSAPRPTRPIVQIVRQQPGLPDLSDLVDRLCPSVALIVPRGADASSPDTADGPAGASGFAVSADGWLLTIAADLPQGPLDALVGDGRRVALADVRTDPVSGLAIVKADAAVQAPLAFNDQTFPRVGQFGLVLATPAGKGCSAAAAMIGSDFLADGGSRVGYVRLELSSDASIAGTPTVDAAGRALGISLPDPARVVIPGPIAAVIVDELIRNTLAPSTRFGFRAIDYAAPLSTRLGDLRSGAGVALVQPKSPAARAGLQAGDIVTAVGDEPVSSASELNRQLDGAGAKAELSVTRASRQVHVTIAAS